MGSLDENVKAGYTVGNEKLVKVLDGASGHLLGLWEKQGKEEGALLAISDGFGGWPS